MIIDCEEALRGNMLGLGPWTHSFFTDKMWKLIMSLLAFFRRIVRLDSGGGMQDLRRSSLHS